MLSRLLTGAVGSSRSATTLRAPANVIARLYHENIIDHYENPRNVGSLDKNDPNVGTVSTSTLVVCSVVLKVDHV